MSLFKNIPASPAVTPEQKKARALSMLKQQTIQDAQQMLNMLDISLRRSMDRVWNNPNATPAEAVAALGTDAGVLFAGCAKVSAFLADAYATAGVTTYVAPVPPTGVVIVINSDGTVTIS